MTRLFCVVWEREDGSHNLMAVFDDAVPAHALVATMVGQEGSWLPLVVREYPLNPRAESLRNGERPYSVLVNPPSGFNVARGVGVPEPSCRTLAVDASWRYRVTVWARDEGEAKQRALQLVEQHPGSA